MRDLPALDAHRSPAGLAAICSSREYVRRRHSRPRSVRWVSCYQLPAAALRVAAVWAAAPKAAELFPCRCAVAAAAALPQSRSAWHAGHSLPTGEVMQPSRR